MARANTESTTIPLYSLLRDWRLRQSFWKAGRDLGDEFGVPVRPLTTLGGGTAAELVRRE